MNLKYCKAQNGDFDRLNEAEPDRDAWEIVVEVNKRIRAEEN